MDICVHVHVYVCTRVHAYMRGEWWPDGDGFFCDLWRFGWLCLVLFRVHLQPRSSSERAWSGSSPPGSFV